MRTGGSGGDVQTLLFAVESEARLEAIRQARAELKGAATEMQVTAAAAQKMSTAIQAGAQAGSRALIDLARTVDVTSADEVQALLANIAAVEQLNVEYGKTEITTRNLANAEGVLAARLADAYGATGRAAVAAAAANQAAAAATTQQTRAAAEQGRVFDANNPKLRQAANAAAMLSMAAMTGTGSIAGMTVAAGGMAQALATMSTSATIAAGAAGLGALVTVLGILIGLLDRAGESARGAGDIFEALRRSRTSGETGDIAQMTRDELREVNAEIQAIDLARQRLRAVASGPLGGIGGAIFGSDKVLDLLFPDQAQTKDRAQKLAQAYIQAQRQLGDQQRAEEEAERKKRESAADAAAKAEAAKRLADAKTAENMLQQQTNQTLQVWLTERQRAVLATAQIENSVDRDKLRGIQRTMDAEIAASRFAEQAAIAAAEAQQERQTRELDALHISEEKKQTLRVNFEFATQSAITAAQNEGERRRAAARAAAEEQERAEQNRRRSYILGTMMDQAEGRGNAGDIYDAKRRQIEEQAALEREAGENEVTVEVRKQARLQQLRKETADAAKQNILSLEQVLIASNSRQIRSIGNFISTLRRIELGYEAIKAGINSLKEGAAAIAAGAAGDFRGAAMHALAAIEYARVAAVAGQESLGGGRAQSGGGGGGGNDRGIFEPRGNASANNGTVINLITRDPYGREAIQTVRYELNRADILKRPALEIPPTTGIQNAGVRTVA